MYKETNNVQDIRSHDKERVYPSSDKRNGNPQTTILVVSRQSVNWDKRIFNYNGDFAYVIDGTVKFWLTRQSPITEYKFVGHGKVLTSVIEDTTRVVFLKNK